MFTFAGFRRPAYFQFTLATAGFLKLFSYAVCDLRVMIDYWWRK